MEERRSRGKKKENVCLFFIGFYGTWKFNDIQERKEMERGARHSSNIELIQLSVYSVIIIWNNIYFLILLYKNNVTLYLIENGER